jgi:dipeptidyl aminopeptidase/acylaminoacyl peptidase
MRANSPRSLLALIGLSSILCIPSGSNAQTFSIEDVLSPGYPFDLVSAQRADRVAWIEYERGMRNVYTAGTPDFTPIRLTEHLLDDGSDLTDLRISDDGRTLVYVRGHAPNREGWVANPTSAPDGAERAVWTVRTDGGEPRRLAVAGNPVLSPDGRWVLFVRGGEIYRVPVDGDADALAAATATPLFRAFGESRDPVWSPDSRKIAFVSDRENHSFVAVYDTEQRRLAYLAPSVDFDIEPAWSPDGRRIAFVRRAGLPFGGTRRSFWYIPQPEDSAKAPRPGLESATLARGYTVAIWVADAVTGEGHEVWHNEAGDSAYARLRNLTWANEHIVFLAEPGNWRHYFSIRASGHRGHPIDLTPGDGFTEHVGLSSDGTHLYYAANVGDIHRRHLWRVATDGGEPEQLTSGEGNETYPVVLASGDRVAYLGAGAAQPQSVALIAARGGEPRLIAPAMPAAFPLDGQVVPVNVTVTAEDGFEFYNQLFVPRDLRPGEKRPALIFIHGGSRRQMLLGYHYMHFYHMAYAMNQYFANQGYVVLSVNYRSGIGYGKAFREAPGRGGRGNTEYLDIRAAGRYLQERPDVDPERIGLWGLSYGGILTAQGLARNSDIFAAGVDMAGVHLWGESLDPDSVSYQSSAIAAIDTWTSPVLLIHGDDDRNVDFSQTVGLVQLLRAYDVPHELIVFPDEVHDFLIFGNFV